MVLNKIVNTPQLNPNSIFKEAEEEYKKDPINFSAEKIKGPLASLIPKNRKGIQQILKEHFDALK